MFFNFTLGIPKTEKEKSKVSLREAIRAVIIKDDKILMVHTNKGDYKFPGGGVESGESHEETLVREVKEETGYIISSISEKIGTAIERSIDAFEKDSIFEMISYYYLCVVSENQALQELDDYEMELGFYPQWLNIDDAIKNNERIIKDTSVQMNNWVPRDTSVLHRLKSIIW